MRNLIYVFIFLSLTFSGCARISPLSPNLDQKIDNQDGKIEELKNNQNGLMLELGKIRQQSEINARDIENAQQGLINLRGSNNSGVQILSGDGGLLIAFLTLMGGIMTIWYYRQRAIANEKTATILAQQIALYNDTDLNDQVFLSAMNTDVEENVYHLMVKSQSLTGR